MCGSIFVPAANSKLQARENARDQVVREGERSGARTDGTSSGHQDSESAQDPIHGHGGERYTNCTLEFLELFNY
jgi:hypothetical protein